nr:putative fungistatic metabolite [Quercus suber]
MAYPIQHYDNGVCPDSHPVPLISIFFEVIYQTNNFADKWWSTTTHPFVFAMGDRTGYGFHGDFINGWDVTALQAAVDTCTNLSGTLQDCPVFANSLFTAQQSQACRIPPTVEEQVTGTLSKLPGCNPHTSGPKPAIPQTCAAPPIGKATPDYTDVTKSLKWKYAGCANDSVSDRTFRGATYFANSMNVTACIAFCKSKGFSLAGLQYASQCYCDNTYSQANRAQQPGIMGNCVQPCAGAASEICGGSNALSVYQNCGGSKTCSNYVFAA